MTIIPPGYADCALLIERTLDPETMVTTHGIRVLSPPFTQANADACALVWAVRAPSLLATSERMIGFRIRVGQDGGDPITYEVEMDVAGTSATERLPQNCAMLISKLSAVGGRRGRGRFFWPSLSEGSVDAGGLMTIGSRDAAQTVFDNVRGDFNTGTASTENTDAMVILHQTGATAPAVITALRVERLIATQRRRLRR